MYILIGILVLCLFVFVHELGHYTSGRLLGFKITEFAVGFGPVILKHESKKNGIKYSLRAFPLGGMCRFYGEDEGAPDGRDAEGVFTRQAPWKRLIVMASGALMNIVLAVVLAAASLMIFGDIVAGVDSVEAGSPAQKAGMQSGDMILAVDGKRLMYASQVYDAISGANSESAVITVEREGKKQDLTLKNIYDSELEKNYIGISPVYMRKSYGFFEAIGGSFSFTSAVIGETLGGLGKMVTQGVQPGDLGGPVQVVEILSQAVRLGAETLMRISVFITVSLGILNILPLPALDGGRMVFVLVEWIRGKPVPPEKEGMVHLIGMILLLALVVYLTFSDIRMLIGG